MTIDYGLIGQRIQKTRKTFNKSQESLAEVLNISVSYMSRIENGKAKLSLELLLKISYTFKKDPGYFLTGVVYHSHSNKQHEIHAILESCSSQKLKMITEIAKIIDTY